MKKVLIKIVSILTIIISTFSMVGIFKNKVKATIYLINEAKIEGKEEYIGFSYNGMQFAVPYITYEKDQKEYPAYGLNFKLPGIRRGEKLNVVTEKTIENVDIWRVIISGYKFKTLEELGCNSDVEAYAATEMAIYNLTLNYDWKNDFKSVTESGKRVLAAAQKIGEEAQKLKEKGVIKQTGTLKINSLKDEWVQDELDKRYISKTYRVNTNDVENEGCEISVSSFEKEIKVTDTNNVSKTKFASGEEFKILIPISSLDSKTNEIRSLSLNGKISFKTFPVLCGEAQEAAYQNYALVTGELESEIISLEIPYPPNKTKIKIVNLDAETKDPVVNAKYQILNEERQVVYTDITTNGEGIAELKGIMPEKYYIKEINPANGYTEYSDIIEADVSFNESCTITVNSYKKPREELKDVEKNQDKTVVGEKETPLPKTGF